MCRLSLYPDCKFLLRLLSVTNNFPSYEAQPNEDFRLVSYMSLNRSGRQTVSQSVSHLETEKRSHLHLYTCVFHVGMFSTIAPSF